MTTYAETASKLSNAELLELWEIFTDKVEGQHGKKFAELWQHYNKGLKALEAEIARRS
jgi:hypothetical protein